ncbi:MAG: 6,7-dimethyl-8-ribityllumazine synthase [Bernardetiaceae bacterium]
MASAQKNLSTHTSKNLITLTDKTIAVVVSEWNEAITEALFAGARTCLLEHGLPPERLLRRDVPGSFELPLACQWMAQRPGVDAVIALGCIIEGETRHFDFIAQAVATGLTEVGLRTNKPVVFGVLTPATQEQAQERAGGRHGNKGEEAAITAIKMLGFEGR